MKTTAKDKITNALVELLSTTPHTKITVTKLIKVAGVNKSTYYYNFSCIEDVIQYLKQSFITKFEETFSKDTMYCDVAGTSPLLKRNAIDMYNYLYENKKAFSVLINSSIRDEFRYDFIRCMRHLLAQHTWNVRNPDGSLTILSQSELSYNLHYQAYANYSFLEQWVKRNFEESPAELARIIDRTMNYSADDYILT